MVFNVFTRVVLNLAQIKFLSLRLRSQNGAKFNAKGFHNPPLAATPAAANRGHAHAHGHTQYHRNTWRRRKRDSLPVSISR